VIEVLQEPVIGAALVAFSSICLSICSLILMLCVIRLGRQEEELGSIIAEMRTLQPTGSRQSSSRHSERASQ